MPPVEQETLTAAVPSTADSPDAKPSESPSTPAETPIDAKADSPESSPEQGAKDEKPSPKPKLRDIVARAGRKAARQEGKEDKPADSPTAEQAAKEPESAAAKTEPATDKKPDEAGKEKAADPDADVPFNKHPRWQEKLAQERTLKERIAKLEPDSATVAELRELTGGEDGFKNLKTLAASFAHDPAASIPMLEQLLNDARNRSGMALTSADLKEKVANGVLTEADAVEIEKSRAGQRRSDERFQAMREQAERDKAEQGKKAQAEALNTWEQNIRQRDPDFGPLTELKDPKHGVSLADQVFDQMALLVMTEGTKPTSPQEAVSLAQRAYEAVKQRVSKLIPAKPAIASGPTSQQSSSGSRPAPRSLRDVVRNAAKGT